MYKLSGTLSVIAAIYVMTKSVKMESEFFKGKHFTCHYLVLFCRWGFRTSI